MALVQGSQATDVAGIVNHYGTERHHLMNVVRDTQKVFGCISPDNMKAIADAMGIHRGRG